MRSILILLTVLFAANAAKAQDKQAITPDGMEWAVEEFGFSPAMRAGDFVYLAGVVAALKQNDDGTMVAATQVNLAAAYETAFERIGEVLAAADASWDDVVEMTTFHTDLPGQGQVFMEVKGRYVKAPYPAWTAIDIDRLWPDNGVTEIKVVAYAPRKDE